MTPAAIVSKLWNFCNVLRDDGMSYGDYVEQPTYLLFLKMAAEIVEDLQTALEQFRLIAEELGEEAV
jgi:type I restriction-modification system DNA methylase subunit